MKQDIKGSVLIEVEKALSDDQLAAVATAIGTSTAAKTAALIPYFGPTIQGEGLLVAGLGLDINKALLGTHECEWNRPFRSDEVLHIKVFVEDLFQKGNSTFAVVVTEFRDNNGGLIASQRTTFIERGD